MENESKETEGKVMKQPTFKRKFRKAHERGYAVSIEFKSGFLFADEYKIYTDDYTKQTRVYLYQANKYIGAINLFDIDEVS